MGMFHMAIMVRYLTCSGKAIAAGGPFPAYQSKNLQTFYSHICGVANSCVWPMESEENTRTRSWTCGCRDCLEKSSVKLWTTLKNIWSGETATKMTTGTQSNNCSPSR